MPAVELADFQEKFVFLFEDTDPSTITQETKFRDLEEWDSMLALSIIAMADEEYNVQLNGEDIRSSETVTDLYNKVKGKQA